jgi:hypothetical protein
MEIFSLSYLKYFKKFGKLGMQCHLWLMPIILATLDAEIRRMVVPSQLRQNDQESSTQQKK